MSEFQSGDLLVSLSHGTVGTYSRGLREADILPGWLLTPGLLSAVCSRSLSNSAMAGGLPVATRFDGRRFVNGRRGGPVYSLYHLEVVEIKKLIYTTCTR